MIASLLAAAACWWMKDEFPDRERLHQDLFTEPKQVRVNRPAINTTVNGVDYRIQPRYSYDLRALVVSLHDSDTWWDYAHKAWNDHINLMDLCVVWGENAQSGIYHYVSFSNDQWTCSFSTKSREAWDAFDMTGASNNHMVTDDPAVAKALRAVRIGDQIRVRGYLVDYTTYKDGKPVGTRVSSEVRTDTGNGACEVLYVESLDLLDSAGRRWRIALKIALASLFFSVLAWMFLPVKFND
jgi:hypothetical protein